MCPGNEETVEGGRGGSSDRRQNRGLLSPPQCNLVTQVSKVTLNRK